MFDARRYLVRCDLFDAPQLFIVAKDRRIMWYGDPATKGLEVSLLLRMVASVA